MAGHQQAPGTGNHWQEVGTDNHWALLVTTGTGKYHGYWGHQWAPASSGQWQLPVGSGSGHHQAPLGMTGYLWALGTTGH